MAAVKAVTSLPAELGRQFLEAVEREQTTESALLREALEAYLARQRKQRTRMGREATVNE